MQDEYLLLFQEVVWLYTLPKNYYVEFLEGLGINESYIKWRFGTHGSWKNQNPEGLFRATS